MASYPSSLHACGDSHRELTSTAPAVQRMLKSVAAVLGSVAVWLLAWCDARAELIPAEATADFGQVSTLQTPKRELILQHHGRTPAELLQAQASCGCVQVEILTPRVEPGQSARLRLTLYPLRSPPGRNIWEVTLRYREGDAILETRLAVAALITREVTVQPPQLDLTVSNVCEHEFVVTDHRAKPFRIVRCETSAPSLSASVVEEPGSNGPPYRWRVRLRVTAELVETALDGQVVLHTNDPVCPRLVVPVRVRRLTSSRILVSPADANLVIVGNMPASRLFTFRDREGKLCRITRVEVEHPALRCQWAEGDFPITTLQVTAEPGQVPAEEVMTRVVVYFAEPNNLAVSIPIRLQRR